MKTRHLPISRFTACPLRVMGCLSLLFGALAFASCSAGSPGKSGPVALQPSHWSKVKDNPPTYYPKGVSADHPTAVSDGMWVMTGDTAGTRYFIPARGVDTQSLTNEALAARTPEESKRINKAGSSSINPAGVFGTVANGIGAIFMEADRATSGSQYTQERGKGQANLLEDKPRR